MEIRGDPRWDGKAWADRKGSQEKSYAEKEMRVEQGQPWAACEH